MKPSAKVSTGTPASAVDGSTIRCRTPARCGSNGSRRCLRRLWASERQIPTVSRWQRLASLAKLLFWLVLIVVVLQQVYGSNRLESARSSVLDRFQQQRKSRVIALIHRQETVTLFGDTSSSTAR